MLESLTERNIIFLATLQHSWYEKLKRWDDSFTTFIKSETKLFNQINLPTKADNILTRTEEAYWKMYYHINTITIKALKLRKVLS